MTQHDPNILYVDADNKISAANEQPRTEKMRQLSYRFHQRWKKK
jgi:hypothetical protein